MGLWWEGFGVTFTHLLRVVESQLFHDIDILLYVFSERSSKREPESRCGECEGWGISPGSCQRLLNILGVLSVCLSLIF